jgi:hypothetical protein
MFVVRYRGYLVRVLASEGIKMASRRFLIINVWVCGFCNVWVCGFCNVLVCEFCNVWMCGFSNVWVF